MLRRVCLAIVLVVYALPLSARDKTQQEQKADLFALIDQADEMIVYSEGFKREFVVYRSFNRKDFDELKSAITLRPNGGPFVCACMDGPEISLLKDHQEIAAIWNHEGTAIGSSVWQGDWENTDPDRWLRWFDGRDMKFVREMFAQTQSTEKQAVVDEQRWLKAMPSSVKPLWPTARQQYDPPTGFSDLKPLNDALAQQFPDTTERIRALLAWFGSGAGPWSGFPGYEEIAAKILRQYPTAEIIKAVNGRELGEQEIEGTARILGSWTPIADEAQIPSDLRRRLLEHCLKSSDQDKVGRARRAFGSD